MNFARFFSLGLKNTLRLLNGTNFSYKGPWVTITGDTVIDEWYVGDFASADYTISVDLNTSKKEMIKCLVVASPQTASVVAYGRTNIGGDLIRIKAEVDNSRVRVIAYPAIQGLETMNGSKLIFSANYYETVNDLRA